MAALQYKDDHNRIAYLGRERGSEDFTDILSYLDHSPLRYALTHDPPVVFDSLVKQFWATATVRPNAAGSHDLVATIDGREVVVTESLIRAQLQLDDANGIFDMQIDDIFAGMGAIGYPPGRTLTFLKHHLSPQWRFLVHTILHCLSPKAGSWNQFPSSIATALVCLSTGRVYNFSRFILEGMIANVKTKKNKFLMYPRFLQMLVAIETADRTPRPTSAFTRKLFSNMRLKWAGEEIPLTPPMLAIAAAGDAADEAHAAAHEAAGSTAEAHPAPHSPPFSPVRESTPERQPETAWVVPNPVSPAPPLSGSAAPTSAGSVFGVPDSTISTSAAMDSAGSHLELGISPFADSDDSSSPSPVSTDHIPVDVLFEPTSGGINEFFLGSDEDEHIGMSRVAADPDSDDEVLAEILFRGQYISGAGVVVVDKLPDDEIVDPRVKDEPVSDYATSPPRSRRKHRGVRSDDSLWDKPVEDFFSSESESDDDIEDYIPPIPYGAFKDWEIVRCPLSTTYYHVYLRACELSHKDRVVCFREVTPSSNGTEESTAVSGREREEEWKGMRRGRGNETRENRRSKEGVQQE
ncbi:hypothetical protein Tco_0151440 [Tanacetum coccineum]